MTALRYVPPEFVDPIRSIPLGHHFSIQQLCDSPEIAVKLGCFVRKHTLVRRTSRSAKNKVAQYVLSESGVRLVPRDRIDDISGRIVDCWNRSKTTDEFLDLIREEFGLDARSARDLCIGMAAQKLIEENKCRTLLNSIGVQIIQRSREEWY